MPKPDRLFESSGDDGRKEAVRQAIKILSDHHEGFVLITCSPPTSAGSMEVEMVYEGDEVLASYLIESAGNIFHGDNEE